MPWKLRRSLIFTVSSAVVVALLFTFASFRSHILRDGAWKESPLQRPGLRSILSTYTDVFTLPPFTLDSQSLYRIYADAIVGDKRSSRAAVCLSTIASLDHLHWLRELSEHWSGPVSVAVFFREELDLQLVVTYVHALRTCFAAIRDNFSFHFVSPLARNDSGGAKDTFAWGDGDQPLFCDSHRALLRAFLAMQRKRGWPRLPFPQNHLRNVARDGCVSSPYFYATDVDVMPQYGLYERMSAFLIREPPCAKCLYVVPAFEGTEFVAHPRTKSALLSRTGKKKDFRVYHAVAFDKNQRATNFNKWKKVPSKGELYAAYEAIFEFGYEGFYVGPHDVPKFREMFIGYGFTRNVQALEAHLAGFRFLVLSDAFTIHRGMRNTTSNESFRNAQKTRNYRIFLAFRKTLEQRYGKGREFT